MKTRRLHRLFQIALALILCSLTVQPVPLAQAHTLADPAAVGRAAQPQRTGVSQTVQGVTFTLANLRRRSHAAQPTTPRQASPRRTFNGSAAPAQRLSASASSANGGPASGGPASGGPASGGPASGGPASGGSIGPDLPQTVVDKIIGPAETDTAGFVPPDTMGAVGSIDFLFSVNGRFRAFTKAMPHTQVFDTDQITFWGSAADPNGVSDAHVRYDRATQRWFITEIDVKNSDNHILLAVSSGPDLSSASWTSFTLAATGNTAGTDNNCFADYDTPGIDQNAIYIGANMFGTLGASPCNGNSYVHSNLYVIQKGPTLTGTANLTTFYAVVTGTVGIETIQGVDSFDSLSTGYAVAVDETESPQAHLDVWQVSNPGTISPTLSAVTKVPISAENGATGGVLTANNVASTSPSRPMDDIDDRLFSAVIRSNHLWTAHNLAVNSSGNSNSGSPTRDAVRWYDVTLPGLTLNQSDTVYDSASNFLEYWMGTVMVSGQGHMALGLNRANISTTVEAGAVGRLAGTPLGTTLGFTRFQTSTADAYTDSSFVSNLANRWGDYTYTSLDPCDDMTMWTTQEYVAGLDSPPIDWGVAAARLRAPPPATPSGAAPARILRGQASVSVAITGTPASGSGFYDTPNSITDPCRKRLTAAVTGNVTVTSVSYTDPLHVQLNLSTVGSSLGPQTVTITNPDGQALGASLLNIVIASDPTTTTLTSAPGPTVFGQSVTFTATVAGSGGPPTGNVTFFADSAPLSGSPLSAGVAAFVTNTLSAGVHTITATYNGDSTFLPSTSSPLTQIVSQANSHMALTSAPNPSAFGQSVTFTATVLASPPSGSAIPPSGSVSFYADANFVGSSPLSAGVATFQTSSLTLGDHNITASYAGDSNFNSSTTSQPLVQTVNQAPSTTTLSSAPNPSLLGQSVTFTATVSASGGPPTGTVTFYDGAPLGTMPLSAGVATFITDTLSLGVNVITATYAGNTNFLPSTSPPLTQTVDVALYLPVLMR